MSEALKIKWFNDTPHDEEPTDNKLDPFTRIIDGSWGGQAVQFEVGASLSTTGLTAGNSKQMTVSTWVFAEKSENPAAFDVFDIDPPSNNFGGASETAAVGIVDPSVLIISACSGAGVATGTNKSLDGMGHIVDTPIMGQGQFQIQSKTLSPITDRWVHLLWSIDLGSFVDVPNDPGPSVAVPKTAIFVDGQDANQAGVIKANVLYAVVDQGAHVVYEAGLDVNGIGNVVNPFDIGISGSPCGIPQTALESAGVPRIRFAQTQVWFGRFLAAADTVSAFISASHHPAKPDGKLPSGVLSPAWAQFGQPDLYFKGGKSTFVKNKGSAGDFSAGGDITDYKPGP